jgi:two-component system chemotaxis sensor kinase CheA
MSLDSDARFALRALARAWATVEADVVAHLGPLEGHCDQLAALRPGCPANESAALEAVHGALQSLLAAPRDSAAAGRLAELLRRVVPAIDPDPESGGSRGPALESEALQLFFDERFDSLDEFDDHASEYEHSGSVEALSAAKRILHSIKGDASLLELDELAAHCHGIEDALTRTAGGGTAELLAEAGRSLRQRLLALHRGGRPRPPTAAPASRAVSHPREALDTAPRPTELPAPQRGEPLDDELTHVDLAAGLAFLTCAHELGERIEVQLDELQGASDAGPAFASLLATVGELRARAAPLNLRLVADLTQELERSIARVAQRPQPPAPEVLATFRETAGILRVWCESFEDALPGRAPVRSPAHYPAVRQRLRAAGDDSSPGPSDATLDSPEPAESLAAGPIGSDERAGRRSVRVDSLRLDSLGDLIGELVITQSMVRRSPELDLVGKARLPGLLGHLEKVTRELQRIATSLRMVPIRATFRRMARLAGDVSQRLGKTVEFVTQGEHTELDKAVVDTVGDPLLHLVRNAIDHGIESDSSERQRAGKPAVGRVALSAYHEGGCVHIVIEDDGRGLDREAILAQAQRRGLLPAEGAELSEAQALELIFAPGFTTANQVTALSGRGVGLDVVRRSVEGLRGRVDVESRPGQGTTFRIRLPLTLAIIDGMVVRAGRERFVVPTLAIVRMFRPRSRDLAPVFGRNQLLRTGGALVPLRRLTELLGRQDDSSPVEDSTILVVESTGGRLAIQLDELIGQQQIVIKPLGASVRKIEGLAGAAVLPDGTVGLVLDIAGLVALSAASAGSSRPPALVTNAP